MEKQNPYGDRRDRIAKLIIALFFILVIVLSNSSSYKPLIYKIFNNYEEECYEYEWYNSPNCVGYWINYNYTRVNGSWKKINVTEPICRCGAWYPVGGCLQTIRLPNESNCLKYHLVRKIT